MRWVCLLAAITVATPTAHAVAQPLNGRVVDVVDSMRAGVRVARYRHRLRVDERRGRYDGDCSDIVSWIVARAAPRAMRAIGEPGRVSARRIFRAIERAPRGPSSQPWQRIDRLADVELGDVFAWQTPPDMPAHHTGHTGIVLSLPRAVPSRPGAFTVLVADSIIGRHQPDTRAWDGEGGFGVGTLLFETGTSGEVRRVGWRGTASLETVSIRVLFGRPRR